MKTHTLWSTHISVMNTEESKKIAAPLYMQAVEEFNGRSRGKAFAYVDSDYGRTAEDLMLAAVNDHARHCYGEKIPSFRIEDCVDIWYFFLPKGTVDNGRDIHNHPMSDFNAVYYMNVDEADLEFYDPRWPNNNLYFTGNNKFQIKPQSGDIIVFEGYLWHQTTAALLQSHRICMVSNWKYPRPYVCAVNESIRRGDLNKNENVPYFNRLKNGLIKPTDYAEQCDHLNGGF